MTEYGDIAPGVRAARVEPHRSAYLKLVRGLEQVELGEAAILAEGYVSRGIFHRKLC
jgi:hypothetical protein